MLKRGQVTVFILLGIVIGISFMLIVFIDNQETNIEQPTGNDITITLDNYVEACLKNVGEQAIYDISSQGGYYIPSNKSGEFYFRTIPYYWYDNENLMPSKEVIEEQLAIFILANIDTCLDNFDAFTNVGYSVTPFSEYSLKTTITPTKVLFDLNFPIEVLKGSQSSDFEQFTADSDINLNRITGLVSSVLEEQENYPNEVPFSFLADLADEENFDFEVIDLQTSEVAISMIFEIPGKEDLVYGFMNEYDWVEEDEEI